MPQRIKRLVIILVVSIIIILLAKSLLSKAVKNLGVEVQNKQKANITKQLSSPPASSPYEAPGLSASADSKDSVAQSAPVFTESNSVKP